jgi:hypothetical protein
MSKEEIMTRLNIGKVTLKTYTTNLSNALKKIAEAKGTPIKGKHIEFEDLATRARDLGVVNAPTPPKK